MAPTSGCSRISTVSDAFGFGLVPWGLPVCRVSPLHRVADAAGWRYATLADCAGPHLRRRRVAVGTGERRALGPTRWPRTVSCICPRLSRCICRRTGSTPAAPICVLLRIDPARLSSPIHWEPGVPTDPAGMVFPHLYGPLPATAVISVTLVPARCERRRFAPACRPRAARRCRRRPRSPPSARVRSAPSPRPWSPPA